LSIHIAGYTAQHTATRCNALQHTATLCCLFFFCLERGPADSIDCPQDRSEYYTHTKEHYTHTKEPYTHTKEPCIRTKKPYVHSKGPCVHTKGPCVCTHEHNTLTKELNSRNSTCTSMSRAGKTAQHNATHYITMQHITVKHCNTLQHTATHCCLCVHV